MTNPDIKIFVVCHKPAYVPDNPYLYPIQVGTLLADRPIEGMLHDNTGDNISEKNRSYCELTAQYWAWKNVDADYYGFFHYRRYLSFDPSIKRDDGWGNIAFDQIDEKAIQELRLNPDDMRRLITKYDVITVKGRPYPAIVKKGKRMDVYSEYGTVPFQHREDLDAVLHILLKKYPEFKEAADEYMHSTKAYECNMFIMKKEIFMNYAAWLFDILAEAERKIDTAWYSVEEYRVFGYLAERLCGIYYTWLKKNGNVKCFELPKTLFWDSEPRAVLKPVFSENAVPVVLSANDRFSPYLDVMIHSVVEHSSPERYYDIIILHNDISERNRRIIQASADGRKNISIRFIRVKQYFDTSKLFVDQHLSVETYYRLIIPEIMPDYSKILYLDCDMVVNHDVAELYDTDLQGMVIGAAKDIDVVGQVGLNQNDWRHYAVETVKLDKPYDYFQAGVLIIDLDQLRKLKSSDEMIKIAMSRKWRCHDQDVLNYVCRNKVYYLPQKWNTLMSWRENDGRSRMQIMKMAYRGLYEEYLGARKDPYIVHFAGYQKPWDVADCDFAEYFWRYARNSVYLPWLIRHIQICLEDQKTGNNTMATESSARRFANKILPYGSRRRECIKKLYHFMNH
jgi:lipopolysaccharide biosynthesis glycosyltransferase